MPLWQAIVLAVVQGLTEFLPISSSGHLALLPWLFGWEEHSLSFDVALHVGTLFAVVLYFYRSWMNLFTSALRFERPPQVLAASSGGGTGSGPDHNPRLLWLLIFGTIPVGLAGLLFQDLAETSWRHPVVIGSAMIAVAFLMAWGERISRGAKDIAHANWGDALCVGISQAFALVPGVSRSGITMTAGLLRDFRRESAARFSFLLSAPAIGGAALKTSLDLYYQGFAPGMFWPFLVGMVVSGIVGYATISFLLKFLQFGTFKIFIYYRVIFGIIVLALAFFLRMEAVN